MDEVDRIVGQWRRERPDLDVGPMELIGRVTRLARHLMAGMEETQALHGLNYATFDVLATLRRAGAPHALTAGALMAQMMITSGTVTNRVDQLERLGLVARRPNPGDGRSVLIALTDAGRARIDAAVIDHVATQLRLVATLAAPERQALDSLLRHWLAAMEPEREGGG